MRSRSRPTFPGEPRDQKWQSADARDVRLVRAGALCKEEGFCCLLLFVRATATTPEAAENGRVSKMCDTTNASTQSIADYLAQLLKDRKQLAAFPNVFLHVERLLEEGERNGGVVWGRRGTGDPVGERFVWAQLK